MHRIPNKTIKLGTALQFVTQDRDYVTTWDEVKGWQVLAGEDAMDQDRPRLFLVKGTMSKNPPHGGDMAAAEQTWSRWHKRHEADFIGGMVDLPDEIEKPMGRAVRLSYRSDKWNNPGEKEDYIHEFAGDGDRPPVVYVDNPDDPAAFCLVGGDMTISERGIE